MKESTISRSAVETSPDLALHRDALLSFIERMVSAHDLAEDLTQETLLRAEKNRASFRNQSSPRTWLFSIAVNACRDHFRKGARNAQRFVELAQDDQVPSGVDLEQGFAQAEMGSCIARYLFQLPERQRDVVALADMGGLDHKEISRQLRISASNARVLLHRGRAALRTLLEENCELSFENDVPCAPRPES